MRETTSHTLPEKQYLLQLSLRAKILLIIGIVLLLIFLIAGGIVLSTMRRLQGDEQIPIVSRESEFVMPEMEESLEYIDDWEQFENMPDDDPTAPEQNGGSTDNAGAVGSVIQGNSVPIFEQNKNNPDVINILLLGRDARDPSKSWGRTDTMIIVSYNKKTHDASMISLLRDTYVPIEGHGYNRINTAFAFGGTGLCINTINDVFSLDIQDYVIIDFAGLVSVIDAVGGVDMHLTADEVTMYAKEGLLPAGAAEGVHHLNGELALRHARNRTLGSDFGRTKRQRDILTAVFDKVTSSLSLAETTRLINAALNMVTTNLSAGNLVSLAADVLANASSVEIESSQLPYAGTFRGALVNGMSVIAIDYEENTRLLHEQLYGTAKK